MIKLQQHRHNKNSSRACQDNLVVLTVVKNSLQRIFEFLYRQLGPPACECLYILRNFHPGTRCSETGKLTHPYTINTR